MPGDLTVRDVFAAAHMIAEVIRTGSFGSADAIAAESYRMADAMMRARHGAWPTPTPAEPARSPSAPPASSGPVAPAAGVVPLAPPMTHDEPVPPGFGTTPVVPPVDSTPAVSMDVEPRR